MTNIVYRNLTKEEAEQMAFELEVEGRFKFKVKEEGGSWSVHYWSEDERPGITDTPESPTAPGRETPPTAPAGGPSESVGSAPVAPAGPPESPPAPERETSPTAPAGGLSEAVGPAPVAPPASDVAEPAPVPSRLFNPPAGWLLGSLSRKYEIGDRGPETVSTGAGDPGGVSYGSYQMTSRGGGTVLRFVRDDNFPWRRRFAGLAPGSKEFSARWKALAAEVPEAFFEAQHAFIERTHFAPLVRRIRSACGLDVTSHSHALQDAVWSTAVQHGPNSMVMNRALAALGWIDTLPPDDLGGDRRLISAIYAERGRKRANGRLLYFPRVTSPQIQKSLADRFANEERDALAMLDS
jgi:hypothetical protein